MTFRETLETVMRATRLNTAFFAQTVTYRLQDGSELREQLLTLSDLEMTFSYCLLDTPIPLFNYVAHVRLLPVTDGNRAFWHWESRFTTPRGREAELARIVGDEVYTNGIEAVRRLPELAREAV